MPPASERPAWRAVAHFRAEYPHRIENCGARSARCTTPTAELPQRPCACGGSKTLSPAQPSLKGSKRRLRLVIPSWLARRRRSRRFAPLAVAHHTAAARGRPHCPSHVGPDSGPKRGPQNRATTRYTDSTDKICFAHFLALNPRRKTVPTRLQKFLGTLSQPSSGTTSMHPRSASAANIVHGKINLRPCARSSGPHEPWLHS